LRLEIQGLGIVLYSPFSVRAIREGEDFLSKHYLHARDVIPHIEKGSIVGFGTGSPGIFNIDFFAGYPKEEFLNSQDFKLRLGLEVRNRTVCIRDLYDLMRWTTLCPKAQQIELEDGYYHLTVCSELPESGTLGDDQPIAVFLKQLEQLPELHYQGVPTLCA